MLAVDESGRKVQFGNRCHYCVNSVEFHKASARIVRAMAERFGENPHVIGWQLDNEYNRVCYCEHCQRNFREAYGMDLPRPRDSHTRYSRPDSRDPAWRNYLLWRQERLFELWRLWDREVRKINPDSTVIPNTGGGATSSLDMAMATASLPRSSGVPPFTER